MGAALRGDIEFLAGIEHLRIGDVVIAGEVADGSIVAVCDGEDGVVGFDGVGHNCINVLAGGIECSHAAD